MLSSLTPAKWSDKLGKPFNDAIPGIVQQQQAKGRKCFFVDMRNEAKFTPDDFADQLHPNTRGYAKMAQVWFTHLKPYLANPTSFEKSSTGGFHCSLPKILGNYLRSVFSA
ncbi:hypothetical protein K9N68_31230 [Kovacikia minuta CCNUW1]|uniref:hypothetical protein n=1 Tax=Kovacikia minuta TaxID=2931930 RepID=UPI001CCF5292|nr:hypothetical protein [Kovacikia minuta]UBF25961.1 hypothetical protein K9N68_31230 [Kovacikia minuta CCNUW1]